MPKDSKKISRIRYYPDPDFSKPLLKTGVEARKRMLGRLSFLYGEAAAERWMPELERVLKVHYAHKPLEMIESEKDFDPRERFTEKDMILITYGDLVRGEESTPLATLHKFIDTFNRGAINTLHILPFFPYSSDRGFAIVKFRSVDPKLGTWEDIMRIESRYDLMFDGVLNHCSSRSQMFREFLRGNPGYKDFFISYARPDDLTPNQRSKIFRPRTSDILTKFNTIDGPRYVWTTFSKDQIDFNFRNPAVLMAVIESLLFYVRRGADSIRLDAVTYIWAEPGTECIHLPQTHEIIKLLRDILGVIAPGVALITETNVPHSENISYFGNGYDEAHMVYNFALPPLVLHTFYTGDATVISGWAQDLEIESEVATFFNIIDTHDGIGLMGVKGILSNKEIDFIIQRAKEHGAYISYKMSEERTEEPYEINSTWWSAVNREDINEDITLQVKRFVASRSISLVLQGVPGVYVHGAIGTSNDHERVRKTGVKRDVNRGVIDSKMVAEGLKNPEFKISLLRLLNSKIGLIRTRNRAFHPNGNQSDLMISPDLFTVLRISPEEDRHILTMTNVTDRVCSIKIPFSELRVEEMRWYDMIGEKEYIVKNMKLSITLEPYDVIWLIPFAELEKRIES